MATKRGTKSGKQMKRIVKKQSDDAVIESVIPFKERVKLAAELARGVTVEESDGEGGTKVYTKPPDMSAIRHLNEMQKGKPAQSTAIKMPEGATPVILLPIVQQRPEKYKNK